MVDGIKSAPVEIGATVSVTADDKNNPSVVRSGGKISNRIQEFGGNQEIRVGAGIGGVPEGVSFFVEADYRYRMFDSGYYAGAYASAALAGGHREVAIVGAGVEGGATNEHIACYMRLGDVTAIADGPSLARQGLELTFNLALSVGK